MSVLSKLRSVPKKRFVAALAVVAATASVATTLAWGPGRDTFTVEKPATYVTFNSITNNPIDGDERNFSRAKDGSGNWTDNVVVKEGETYKVRMLVHNNAADNLNLKAVNTRVSASVPTTTGKAVTISNFVSADNAKPSQVWDDIKFTSDKDFNLVYVPGSARIYNNGYAAGGNGQAMPDSIVTSAGAKVGYEKAGDGIVPGCFKYLSYVEYTVKPQVASGDFEMSKTVRKAGETTWSETVATKPGDKVQYRIKYQNKGTVQQDNVTVRDTLPTGVSYVPGSSKLYLASDPNTARPLSDNVTKTGVNIGSYAPGGMALVIFDATVNGNENLPVCGPNTLKNVASVETDYGKKEDDAYVTVPKECKPEVKKIRVCELSSRTVIEINEDQFDASKHSKNLDDCKPVVKIKVCELSSRTVIEINEKDFNASKHSKDLNDCKPVVKIHVCELATKQIIQINEKDFDTAKHSKNLEDCKPAPEKLMVCELSSRTVIEINADQYDETKHSKNLDDCKPVVKVYVCEIESGNIVEIVETDFNEAVHTRDLNVCQTPETPETPETPVTPETPAVLPSTGPESVLAGLFGSSAIGYGAYSMYAARRSTNGRFTKK